MSFVFCPHGYWVSPEGDIEPIRGWQGHRRVAPEICERYGVASGYDPEDIADQLNAKDALCEAGWLNVTIGVSRRTVELDVDELSPPKQLRALIKIVREHGKDPNVSFFTFESYHPDHRDTMALLARWAGQN